MAQIKSSQNNSEVAEKSYSQAIELRKIVNIDYAR
ncbi:MAG: hypothetical protein ACJASL_003898 [Paraglaciecola sp.]|jgi:hypothetical protein